MGKYSRNDKWKKTHTTRVAIVLYNTSDSDILAYLEGRPKGTAFKAAIREYMKNHPTQDTEEAEDR